MSMTVADLLARLRAEAEAGRITGDTLVVTGGDDEGWCCVEVADLSVERIAPLIPDAETRIGALGRVLGTDDSDPRQTPCVYLWPEVRR